MKPTQETRAAGELQKNFYLYQPAFSEHKIKDYMINSMQQIGLSDPFPKDKDKQPYKYVFNYPEKITDLVYSDDQIDPH